MNFTSFNAWSAVRQSCRDFPITDFENSAFQLRMRITKKPNGLISEDRIRFLLAIYLNVYEKKKLKCSVSL